MLVQGFSAVSGPGGGFRGFGLGGGGVFQNFSVGLGFRFLRVPFRIPGFRFHFSSLGPPSPSIQMIQMVQKGSSRTEEQGQGHSGQSQGSERQGIRCLAARPRNLSRSRTIM